VKLKLFKKKQKGIAERKTEVTRKNEVPYKTLALGMLLLLTSCSPKIVRRTNKATKKLKQLEIKYADVWSKVNVQTVRIDTVLERVEIPGETMVTLDTTAVDSLTTLVMALVKADSADKEPITERITRFITQSINIDSVDVDTLDLHLKIWYDKPSTTLQYSLVKDESTIVLTTEVDKIAPVQYIPVYKIPWWIWLIVVILALLSLREFIPKIKLKWPPI
jgi:hypothetical protein